MQYAITRYDTLNRASIFILVKIEALINLVHSYQIVGT